MVRLVGCFCCVFFFFCLGALFVCFWVSVEVFLGGGGSGLNLKVTNANYSQFRTKTLELSSGSQH